MNTNTSSTDQLKDAHAKTREVDRLSVMQLIHSNEGGGVEALAGLIGVDLEARGYDVQTRFLYPTFSATPLRKLGGIALAVKQILFERPDVLVAYQSTASVIAGIAGTLAGCKTRIVHQTAMPAEVHPFVRVLDKIAGSIGLYTVNIANSATTAAAFAGYPNRYVRSMTRIDHGLDAPRAVAPKADVLRSFDIPNDAALVLVTTGRLCDQKAQGRAIRALALVPNARLLVAGGGPDDATLRALTEDCGVTSRVHFLGVVTHDRIGDVLGAADVFVFTTRWETFGLAAVEAAMAGLAIVASDIPILRDVLSTTADSPVAFVDTADATALAAAIESQRDTGQNRVHRETYRDAIRAKYSKERMLGAYRALLPGPPPRS